MQFKGFHRTRTHSSDLTLRKHTPWIASPCANHGDAQSNLLRPYESYGPRDENDQPVFQHNHESSTVELFYDLFFVANLATFTINREMVNGDTVKNYLGFFALMWFTWLQTSLFDVRFASDSVFNRICKAVSFAVMVGFAVSGALYDTTEVIANVKAFRAMALILMVSRLTLFLQYGVVLFYVRKFQSVYAPLLSTMAVMFVAAMIFLGTTFGFSTSGETESGEEKQPRTYIAWYVVVALESFAVIIISSFWRVVSFKHTHLVERIGLLTLIIMGEGIFGMIKAVSKILETSNETSGRDIGVIAATLLLIYFIWVLYFDQIEHDRFGTIRQQIWTLLHFPLHVAILLTVEGAANLVIWNIISPLFYEWLSLAPWTHDSTTGYDYLFDQFANNSQALADYMEEAIKTFATLYKEEKKLTSYYDYQQNITFIRNMTDSYIQSDEGAAEAIRAVGEMWYGVTAAIFESFGWEQPEAAIKNRDENNNESYNELLGFLGIVRTIFLYYFIAAGFFLIVLAIVYWFGKTKKSWQEWTSMGVRAFFGINLALIPAWIVVANNSNRTDSEYVGTLVFYLSAWHIPMVMLTFFVVIVLDNVLVWHTNNTIAKQTISGHYDEDGEAAKNLPQKNGYMAASTGYEGSSDDTPKYSDEVRG